MGTRTLLISSNVNVSMNSVLYRKLTGNSCLKIEIFKGLLGLLGYLSILIRVKTLFPILLTVTF